ncbi:NAD(P)-dependent alcohol dehydrogenase [Dactylosporangium sp. NPDC005572]|uniref:NAD(P)-dependent alcohol dehydrogenase n=1 Tax=Dactylosporangium sp. NPDC005572 TaxID=3156889 RepID=UPI00339F3974
MTTTATAAVLRDRAAAYSVEQVTLADLGPNEVLVRIVGAGMCHTDLVPRTMGLAPLPIILGHEGSGVVVETGSEVSVLAPGDHVVLSFASCGTCTSCGVDQPAYCDLFMPLNMTGRRLDGNSAAVDEAGQPIGNRWFGQSSFASHVIADARSAVKVDPDLPLELLGPLGCGLQTGAGVVLNEMRLRPGQRIAVFGVGAVGLAAIMAAKSAGASEIVAVDLNKERLALAARLGATRTVDGAYPDLITTITTGGGILDFALDTTGIGDVMTAALGVVGTGGLLVLVGSGADALSVHPVQLVGKRVTYVLEGSADPQTFIPVLIDAWRKGRFPFEQLVRTYAFDQIAQAEADAASGVAVKPVLLLGS